MTRKDYELIASAIDRAMATIVAQTRQDHAIRAERIDAIGLAAISLEVALGQDNSRFDDTRFRVAATQGPLYLAALNDEVLARELGPGTSSDLGDVQGSGTTDRYEG